MAGAEGEVQYLVLADGVHPFFLARVRWPDIAQAISEDRPDWLDDPGLFDLPYQPASERVSASQAAELARRWGSTLPPESRTGFSYPRLRRIPANWSDMVPEERRAWFIEHRRVDPDHPAAMWYDALPPPTIDIELTGDGTGPARE